MRSPTRIITDTLLFALAALTASGCVYTNYKGKEGVGLVRVSVFGNQSAGKVDLANGTIEAYSSEQAEIAGAVVAAAVKAAVKP